MARPQKQTADYFPHLVSKGRTKLILQNEFGNDGYAFWYQLLELLCASDGQMYDYNNPASWRLLLAETHVAEALAVKILQLLADLGAIDPELHQSKIIWSQNLVDNLELVYRRRATGVPQRPVIASLKPSAHQAASQKPSKKQYADNVFLSEEEYQKLIAQFGEPATKDKIEALSLGIASKGYKYKDHYATILNWDRKDRKEIKNGKARRNPQAIPKPHEYTRPENLCR